MFSTPEWTGGVSSSRGRATAFSPKIAIVAIAAAQTISRVPACANGQTEAVDLADPDTSRRRQSRSGLSADPVQGEGLGRLHHVRAIGMDGP